MKTSQNYLPALFCMILFLIGALFLFGIAFLMGFAALASLATGTEVKAQETIFLVTLGFEGLVLVAAAFFSLQKYLQHPSADQVLSLPISNWLIVVFISVAGGSLAIGYGISTSKTLEWLVLPILTVPAVVLPLAALLSFGARKLPFGTRWQTWTTLGLSMTLTPLALFVLEILAAIVILLLAVIYVLSQPEMASRLQAISQQIMILGPQSQAASELLSPFLTKPGVVVTALVYMAVLVPGVEEIFKPLGVWLFADKLESQAQGFALGALGGAGYAFIETIWVSGQSANWADLLLTRIGTGLLHITTAALMGAAIVLARRERRYVRLLGTYFLAILLHGLWNAVAILSTFSSIAQTLKQTGGLAALQPALLAGVTLLSIGLFAILVISGYKIRRTTSPSPAPSSLPEANADTDKTLQ